jgi:hypothetical protein
MTKVNLLKRYCQHDHPMKNMKKIIILFLLIESNSYSIAYADNNIANTQEGSIKTNSTEIDTTRLNQSKEWNLTPSLQ